MVGGVALGALPMDVSSRVCSGRSVMPVGGARCSFRLLWGDGDRDLYGLTLGGARSHGTVNDSDSPSGNRSNAP